MEFNPNKCKVLTDTSKACSALKMHGLSDCNWTRTHNHLVHKQTLNHLAKLAQVVVGFESSCGHLNFRFHTCFNQGVP